MRPSLPLVIKRRETDPDGKRLEQVAPSLHRHHQDLRALLTIELCAPIVKRHGGLSQDSQGYTVQECFDLQNIGMRLAVLSPQPTYPVHNGQQQRKDRDLKADDKVFLGDREHGGADGTLKRWCTLGWTR